MGYYTDYFRAEVQKVTALTPTMIRITFGGEGLQRFVSSGDPDERLVVVLPGPGERHTPAPIRQADGTLDYPADNEPEMRSYTVRRFDPETPEMVLDVVRHEGGVAAAWALGAQPGDVVYLSPAKGWYSPPAGTSWQLLLADLTGLPALGRIVEELPAGTRAIAVGEIATEADQQVVESAAHVTYHWVVAGNGHGPSRLLEILKQLQFPEGPGYIWFAGEAADSRTVRKYVRRELGWTTDRFTIIGYWRVDQERWLARYEPLGGTLEKVYSEAVARGLSEGDALDAYEDALEKAGL